MTSPIPFGPYSDVRKYVKTLPTSAPPGHQDRVAAYGIFRELYWTHNGTVKVMNRGLDEDDTPLYVPSARIVVDTMDRYVGPDMRFLVDPQAAGTPQSRLDAQLAIDSLMKRERFYSRYAANKLAGITVGDWCWHIVADPAKPQGRRLSILPLRPDHYFTVYEDEVIEGGDPDTLVRIKLVEIVQVGDEQQARVQTYDRTLDEAGTIYSSLEMWKPEEWYDETKSPLAVLSPPTPLPAAITAFPVYHIPNGLNLDNEPWGMSQIRGLAQILEALNQSNTDEDLSLALMGIGVYATDEPGRQTDATGNPTDWFISPGAVISNAKGLRKVEGLTSLAPYTDHINRLEGYMADATGATDAARGRLEVSEAESGIALTLRLAPTLAIARRSDQIVLDVHNQMIHDIVQMWLPTYEQMNFTDVQVNAVLGDKLPVNRAAEVELVGQLTTFGILSKGSARTYLISKGFSGMFDPAEGDLVLAEQQASAKAAVGGDDTEERADEELTDAGE